MACMYGNCKNPVNWEIWNSHGGRVAELCENHRKNTWAAAPHEGMEVLPKGDKPSGEPERKPQSAPTYESGGELFDLAARQNLPAVRLATRGSDDHTREGGRAVDLQAANSPKRELGLKFADPDDRPGPRPSLEPPLLDWRLAGSLVIDEAQQAILEEAGNPAHCQIKSDGTVYYPWTSFTSRLNAAFRPGGWAMVPLDKPSMQDNTIYVHYALVIRGIPISESIQGHEYNPKNRKQDYADAVESAKSECLRRCCKQLGIMLEPWDPQWRQEWMKQYACRVFVREKNEYQWRRRDAAPLKGEGPQGKAPQSEYEKPADFDDQSHVHLAAINEGDTLADPLRRDSHGYEARTDHRGLYRDV